MRKEQKRHLRDSLLSALNLLKVVKTVKTWNNLIPRRKDVKTKEVPHRAETSEKTVIL